VLTSVLLEKEQHSRYTSVMLSRIFAILLVAAVANAAESRDLPPDAQTALEAAITTAATRFNADEEQLREQPKVEKVGPGNEPYMLRATYRRAGGKHDLVGVDPGEHPVVTVRMRASEFEKRATNVNAGDLEAQFAKARWLETPRGYLLDFRLRWTGKEWEQLGEPAAHPTLGVAGREAR